MENVRSEKDGTLTYEEAKSIYEEIASGLDENDEDEGYLLENLKKRAVRYGGIRSGWFLLSQKERMEDDSDRTSAHDAFISAVNMVDRYMKGNKWRKVLGENRKRIGDFAGYVSLFLCLESR